MGRTGQAGATICGLPFLAHNLRAAHRADGGHRKAPFLAGTLLRDGFHHIGDDIAGSFNNHGVANTDVFALDFIHIVQGSAFDGHAADMDRRQLGHRGQRADPADLRNDIQDGGRCLDGREFIRRGPAG